MWQGAEEVLDLSPTPRLREAAVVGQNAASRADQQRVSWRGRVGTLLRVPGWNTFRNIASDRDSIRTARQNMTETECCVPPILSMNETPKFIQGVFTFRGAGLEHQIPLTPAGRYTVPFDKRAQLIYLRAGNATSELVYLALNRGGKTMRLFPVGAKEAVHVPLSIVEDVSAESELELCVGAPEGLAGALVIDLGVLEI